MASSAVAVHLAACSTGTACGPTCLLCRVEVELKRAIETRRLAVGEDRHGPGRARGLSSYERDGRWRFKVRGTDSQLTGIIAND
jgi:hypothetical protein